MISAPRVSTAIFASSIHAYAPLSYAGISDVKGSSTDADAEWAAAVCPVATVLCFTAASSRDARRELRARLLPRIVDRRVGPGLCFAYIPLVLGVHHGPRLSCSTWLHGVCVQPLPFPRDACYWCILLTHATGAYC